MMRNAGKGMEDTFTSGFIAGVVSGCITSSLDFILVKLFKFGDLLFIDFAGFVSFNHHPGNFPEYLYALIIQLLFSGNLGWIFYALIKKSPYNQMFKGIIYGITVWFIIYGVLFLCKIDYDSAALWLDFALNPSPPTKENENQLGFRRLPG
jgi:hypothetical protein